MNIGTVLLAAGIVGAVFVFGLAFGLHRGRREGFAKVITGLDGAYRGGDGRVWVRANKDNGELLWGMSEAGFIDKRIPP